MPNFNELLANVVASGKMTVIGLVWYEEADYPEILSIMVDGNLLTPNHSDWLRKAQQNDQNIKDHGGRVVRTVIKPKDFRAWCMANGHTLDVTARRAFANEQAARQAGLI